MKEVIIIDGSAYLYRSFYALPNLSNPAGFPTGAIYGVINMLRGDLAACERVIIVFDPRGDVTRHKIYPDYKANRPPMPTDLGQQIEPLFTIIRALGVPLVQVPEYEADDVIGTLAHQAVADGYKVRISSADKDLAQLVTEDITLVNTMHNSVLDIAGVKEKFGIGPELIIDYLALVGDTSDNIPGIPKVGPKTAVKWLNQYHNLAGVVEHQNDIGGKVGENLRANLDKLELARELVTLDCNLSLGIEFTNLVIQEPDNHALLDLYIEYNFRRWADGVRKDPVAPQAIITVQDEVSTCDIESLDEVNTWLNTVDLASATVALAVYYAPGEYNYELPVVWALGVDDKVLRCSLTDRSAQTLLLEVLRKTKLLHDSKRIVTTHLKGLAKILTAEGISFREDNLHDLKVKGYVVDSNQLSWDLARYFRHYLGREVVNWDKVVDKKFVFAEMADKWLPQLTAWANLMLKLDVQLDENLAKIPSLQQLYLTIEHPLTFNIARMEACGITVNPELLHNLSENFADGLEKLSKEIVDITGVEFNLSSPQQLAEVLYTNLKLPILKKTPKGKPSTSEEVLTELALAHPVPAKILRYRTLSKLKSTYTDKLPVLIEPASGRIHGNFNQIGTVTGRLSANAPNLQNIPIRDPEGQQIRRAFEARSGYQLISADYSQVELRIMAHLSADRGLISAFKDGLDIHTATAAEVFSCDIEQVTSEQRSQAKAVNFGLIYGMSAFGLAKQLQIGRSAAQELIERYFSRYPEVKLYMEQTRLQATEDGYVETLLGRRLYLPDIKSNNHAARSAALRAAINAPMQGSCADMIKLAMLRVTQELKQNNIAADVILQVHDELVIEAKNLVVDNVINMVTDIMGGVVELKVPLVVNCQAGNNWLLAHA